MSDSTYYVSLAAYSEAISANRQDKPKLEASIYHLLILIDYYY